MFYKNLSRTVLLAAVSLTFACSGSDGSDGAKGATGDDGAPGEAGANAAIRVTAEAAGANCAGGGQKLETGIDTNSNGALDDDEVVDTSYICGGADGEAGEAGEAGQAGSDGGNAMINASIVDPGAICPTGGQQIEYGTDADGNGTLDAAEVDGTYYVCNGETGADGAAGANGLQSLVDVTDEPSGANCAGGGSQIDWGIDDNGNGTLDPAEVDGTEYVCDGVFSQSRYGVTTDLGQSAGSYGANFLLGIRLNVPTATTLTGFGYWGYDTDQFRMALYSDSGGNPNQLIAQVGPQAMQLGSNEISVSSTPLPAGDYWIMGLYQVGSTGVGQGPPSTTIKYRSVTFSSPLPQTFGAPQTYSGNTFNYWIVTSP